MNKPEKLNKVTDALSSLPGEQLLLMAIFTISSDLVPIIKESLINDPNIASHNSTREIRITSCLHLGRILLKWRGKIVVG